MRRALTAPPTGRWPRRDLRRLPRNTAEARPVFAGDAGAGDGPVTALEKTRCGSSSRPVGNAHGLHVGRNQVQVKGERADRRCASRRARVKKDDMLLVKRHAAFEAG